MPKKTFAHRPPKNWTKLTTTLSASHADTVAAYLAEMADNGIEQNASPLGDPALEQIIAYLPEGVAVEQVVATITALLNELDKDDPAASSAQFVQERVEEEDWNQRWKEHFKPFKLTERLVIKPSWEPYDKLEHEIVLEMDPGMAFGTGLHASTQLALLLIEESLASKPAQVVLDIGTGTGILGMDCALLGAVKVVGIDNDIDARTAAQENVVVNHLEAVMTIDPRDVDDLEERFDLVIANITQDVLTLLAPAILARLESGGRLVLSGILAGSQTDAIRQLYGELGLTLIQSKSKEEWTGLLFERL